MAANRRTAVITYDDSTRGSEPLPLMCTKVYTENPVDHEIEIVKSNQASITAYFKTLELPPCMDTHCLRCKDRIDTYVLCVDCTKLSKNNYFAMGIVQRTLYMQHRKKEPVQYDAEADERSKSANMWQNYFAPVYRPPAES